MKVNANGDSLQVGHDGTLVALVDRVLRVGRVRAVERVVPFSGDGRASGNFDDRLRDRLVVGVDAAVADEVVRGYVGNRLPKKPRLVGFQA